MKNGVKVSKNIEDLKEHSVSDMKTCSQMLQKVKEIILTRDGKKAAGFSKEINEYRQKREREFWEKLVILPPLSHDGKQCVFLCNMIEARVRETLYLIEGMTKRAGLVYFIGDSN